MERNNNLNKTVYITGAAGLIGSNLVSFLLEKGYKIKACDNLIGGLESNVYPYLDRIDFKSIDVTDFNTLKEHMAGSDIVFHCASLPYEGLSVFSPNTIVTNIINTTMSVATSCIINKVELLVNFSSMARYGNITPPFTEDMRCKPADPYGLAKLQAEEQLALLNKIHGLKYFTVVPHNVIGIGQRYMDPYRNVVGIMINRALSNKSFIIYGDGEQKRSFSNINDCVEVLYEMINSTRDLTGEVYNIGPDGNEISINKLAKKISILCNKKLCIDYYPDRPAEVKNAWCSSTKIRYNFNYAMNNNIDDTIAQMVLWIKALGSKSFDYDNVPIEIANSKTPKTWTNKIF